MEMEGKRKTAVPKWTEDPADFSDTHTEIADDNLKYPVRFSETGEVLGFITQRTLLNYLDEPQKSSFPGWTARDFIRKLCRDYNLPDEGKYLLGGSGSDIVLFFWDDYSEESEDYEVRDIYEEPEKDEKAEEETPYSKFEDDPEYHEVLRIVNGLKADASFGDSEEYPVLPGSLFEKLTDPKIRVWSYKKDSAMQDNNLTAEEDKQADWMETEGDPGSLEYPADDDPSWKRVLEDQPLKRVLDPLREIDESEAWTDEEKAWFDKASSDLSEKDLPMQYTPKSVVASLLSDRPVKASNGWSILIDSNDQVVTWPPTGDGFATSIANIDRAASDFCKMANKVEAKVAQEDDPDDVDYENPDDRYFGKDYPGDTREVDDYPGEYRNKYDNEDEDDGELTSDLEEAAERAIQNQPGFFILWFKEGPQYVGWTVSWKTPNAFREYTNLEHYDNFEEAKEIAEDLADKYEQELVVDTDQFDHFLRRPSEEDDAEALEELSKGYDSWKKRENSSEPRKGNKMQLVDTFLNKDDGKKIYAELTKARPSEALLKDIADPEKWIARQTLRQLEAASLEAQEAEMPDMQASAPPGWEKTVEEMKKDPEIDNPFALAWSMHNKGMKPGGKESSRHEAGPKLREKWNDIGDYTRDLEAESAEELHALTVALGGGDYDLSKFTRPKSVEQQDLAQGDEEDQLPPEQDSFGELGAGDGEGAGDTTNISASKKLADEFEDEEEEFPQDDEPQEGDLVIRDWGRDSGIFEVGGRKIAPADDWDEIEEAIRRWSEKNQFWPNVWKESDHGNLHLVTDIYSKKSSKEAVDESAKDYWSKYMGDYGKKMTKDDVKGPKPKEYKTKPAKPVKKDKKEAQQAPAPEQEPAAPAAPAPRAPAPQPGAAPAGQPAAPKAPLPKGPAQPEKLEPGAGDSGIQALGWTAEDVRGMTDAQKKGILQLKLQKPGTQPAQQTAPKTPAAPTAPAPKAPAAPETAPKAPAAPQPEQTPPRQSARLAREIGDLLKKAHKQAQELDDGAAPPAATAPTSMPALTPKTTAPKPVGNTEPTLEDQAFNILQEVRNQQFQAADPTQLKFLKYQELLRRLQSELGMTITEAEKLFGVSRQGKGFLALFE